MNVFGQCMNVVVKCILQVQLICHMILFWICVILSDLDFRTSVALVTVKVNIAANEIWFLLHLLTPLITNHHSYCSHKMLLKTILFPNTQNPLVVRLFLMNDRFRILGAERVPAWGPRNADFRRCSTLYHPLLIPPQSYISPTECIFGFHLFFKGLWGYELVINLQPQDPEYIS